MNTAIALSLADATLIGGLVTGLASAAVGGAAIAFAWRSTANTLRQQRDLAADERKWRDQRSTYQELAQWLAANHLLGSDDPFYEPNVLSSWTFDPGQELEAKARLLAAKPVVDAVIQLRDKAKYEKILTDMFRAAMEAHIDSSVDFKDHSFSKTLKWNHPNDAQKQIDEARQAWDSARTQLEDALRDVFKPPDELPGSTKAQPFDTMSPGPWAAG